MTDEGISEYEKRRLMRISENKARMETLGLPHLAFSLIGSSSKQQLKAGDLKMSKDKRRIGAGDGEDEEYRPSDDDGGAEEDGEEVSSVDSEEGEENTRASFESRRKNKKSSLIAEKFKRRSNAIKVQNESDFIDDEAALIQAIALSLGENADDSAGTSVNVSQSYATNIAREDAQGKKYKAKAQESTRRKKVKAPVQLTEDEVAAYFFSFDETGKGYITPRDVKKMVTAHDFSWTDIEIAHMINSFNSHGDGKLNLEDFRSIVSRCKMMQVTEKT